MFYIALALFLFAIWIIAIGLFKNVGQIYLKIYNKLKNVMEEE